MNRRKFVKQLPPLATIPFLQTSADTILYNANVITVDPKQPRAQAIAILGDRILAVGDNDQIKKYANGFTKKIDVGGKTITPGFIDAHSHPASSGRRHLRNVNCDLRSISAIQDAIKARADKTPAGEWVSGFLYDDTKTKEGRFINRYDIDAVVPNHPVYIGHRGGHTAYVNSKALALVGYTKDTPDPPGGQIDRDPATGEPTGLLKETATDKLSRLMPAAFDEKDYQAGAKLISEMMTETGVTTVTDAYGSPKDLRAYQDAYHAGELKIRVYSMIGYYHIDEMLEAGIRTGFGNNWVKVGGMKLTCDGSISERTARLSKPYVGSTDDYGIIVMDEDALYEYAIKAHKADWQIGIHANGDVGIDIALTVFERLQKEYYRKDPRFRLEHCTVINKDLVQRIKALNAIPNPFSTYVYFHGEKMVHYGADRLENMFALRSFLDAGINVTQTSDYPPGPFEPMMALQSSVTRTDMNGTTWGLSQKITVDEAIKIGTMHGAYASYEEDIKGSLESGKLADLVVLGSDITKIDPHRIIETKIERTMVGGNWVYES